MIALFQLEQGVPIPSKTESPDFVYTFYALISCSNTGTWTVTVDTSACVTQSDMSAAITEAVKTKQDKIMVKGLLLGDGEREHLCGSRRKGLRLSACNRLRSADRHDRGYRGAALL